MSARQLHEWPNPATRRIRTLLVDDSPYWLSALTVLLRGQDEIEIVGTATGGNFALGYVDLLRPDLVVMNLQMPDINALDATIRVRRKYPSMRVVVLTGQDSPSPDLRQACEFSGAEALVTKRRAHVELMTEIQRIFHAPVENQPADGELPALKP